MRGKAVSCCRASALLSLYTRHPLAGRACRMIPNEGEARNTEPSTEDNCGPCALDFNLRTVEVADTSPTSGKNEGFFCGIFVSISNTTSCSYRSLPVLITDYAAASTLTV